MSPKAIVRPLTILAALILAVSACSSSSSKKSASSTPAGSASQSGGSTTDPSASLIAAAKAEGKVTFYTALAASSLDPVISAFQSKYGITVDVVRLLASALPARYETEEGSGIHTADLVASSEASAYETFASKGYTTGLDAATMPALSGLPSKYLHDNKYVDVNIQPLGILYNNSSLKATDISKWTDLLNSKYSGKIAMPDPAAVVTYIGLLELLNSSQGANFVTNLAKQNLKVVPAQPAAAQLVSSGEDPIAFPIVPTVALPLIAAGAPVAIKYLSPTTGVELYGALASKSAHPNAAKLLLNYIMTVQGQTLLDKGTAASALTATVPGSIALPAGYQSIDEAKSHADTPTILKQLGRS